MRGVNAYKDTKTGLWYVQYREKDKLTGQVKQKKKRGFKTKRDALDWADLNVSKTGNSSVLKLGDAIELYLKESAFKKSSEDLFLGRVKNYFPDLETKISEINKEFMITWRDSLALKDLKTVTKNNIVKDFKSYLNFISERFDIEIEGLKYLKGFKKKAYEKNKVMTVWNVEDYNKFREFLGSKFWVTLFDFMFWSGCRRGECLGLQKRNIDFDRGTVTFEFSYNNAGTGLESLKTSSSYRTIQLDNELLEELKELCDAIDGSFVFGADKPVGRTLLENVFKETVELSGVKLINLHGLRHSHATLLLQQGVSVMIVSRRLGHSNPQTTYRTYAHVIEALEEETTKTIEQLRNK